MCGLSGSMTACSGLWANRYSLCAIRYWSMGEFSPTRKTTDSPRLPPGATGLLPGAGDGAGIADENRRIEAADVDAEFERVRACDAEDLAVGQLALDLAPLLGQIAAAVCLDAARKLWARWRRDTREWSAVSAPPSAGCATNAMVCTPPLTSDVISSTASHIGLLRSPPASNACCPPTACRCRQQAAGSRTRISLARAGCRRCRSELISAPVIDSACALGLAIVAEQQMNCGFDP